MGYRGRGAGAGFRLFIRYGRCNERGEARASEVVTSITNKYEEARNVLHRETRGIMIFLKNHT